MDHTDKPTIAFAGGGHAHLHSLLRTGELVGRGFDVVLVNPSPYLYYSGMATGVVSGIYTPEEDRIDVRHLVERGGGRFIRGRVEKVLPEERTLLLEGGGRVPYDAASFCLGSEVVVEDLAGDQGTALPVKPVENAAGIHDFISGYKGARRGPRVVIAGGGAAGCEVAANAARLLEDLGLEGRLTLVEEDPSLLDGSPKKAQKEIRRHLQSRGVEVLTGCRITSYEDGVVTASDGRRLDADLLVVATGTVPPPVFRRSGLPVGDDGGLRVNEHLQSVGDERLFGGGDAVSLHGATLPGLGVFAIRQAPILYHNLQATLRNEPLKLFKPQKRYLYVLNLGDGTGLAVYGSLVWRGRTAWWLKRYIDRKFINSYRG